MIVATLKTGDLKPTIQLRLKSDGEGVDLTDAQSIKANLLLPHQTSAVERDVAIADQEDSDNYGLVTLTLESGDTDVPGLIRFEIEVIWPVNQPQTWPVSGALKIRVNDDVE